MRLNARFYYWLDPLIVRRNGTHHLTLMKICLNRILMLGRWSMRIKELVFYVQMIPILTS